MTHRAVPEHLLDLVRVLDVLHLQIGHVLPVQGALQQTGIELLQFRVGVVDTKTVQSMNQCTYVGTYAVMTT